jgi:hypothetical protein
MIWQAVAGGLNPKASAAVNVSPQAKFSSKTCGVDSQLDFKYTLKDQNSHQ